MKSLTRAEKIKTIGGLLSGKVKLNEVLPLRRIEWWPVMHKGRYINEIDGIKYDMDENEFEEWLKTRRGRNERHFVFVLQEGNDPLPNQDEV